MLTTPKTIRCRMCNTILQGFSLGHICPKANVKTTWRTKVNTSHGRTERQMERLMYMEEHPKMFGKKKLIKIR